MTHLKAQLHQMLQACKPKIIISFVCISCFGSLLSACQKQPEEVYTYSEWIHEIVSASGITLSLESTPYFIHINSDTPYFNDIQAAVEWGVLRVEDGFQEDALVNREFTAYTLMNLVGKDVDSNIQIKDANQCTYLDEVKGSIASGLMQLDKRSMFHPLDHISKDECNTLLDTAIEYLNNQTFIDEEDDDYITYQDDDTIIQISPETFDEDQLIISLPQGTNVNDGDYISWYDDQNQSQVTYKVQSHIDDQTVQLEDMDLFDFTEEIHISGEDDIDFDQANITYEDGSYLANDMYGIDLLSTQPLSKSYEVNGFKVKISTSSNQMKAEVSRVLEHGAKLYADIIVNGIHVDYKWFSKDSEVNTAYFKVKFQSQEDLGIKQTE